MTQRRVPVLWVLLLLFTVVPALELFVLLQIGALLGPTTTVALILLTGVCGAWLAKREGIGVLQRLQDELAQGASPGQGLMEGALVVIGGVLLVTPGVLTDLTGFLLIAPPSRRIVAARTLDALAKRIEVHDLRERQRPPSGGAAGTHPFASPFDDLP